MAFNLSFYFLVLKITWRITITVSFSFSFCYIFFFVFFVVFFFIFFHYTYSKRPFGYFTNSISCCKFHSLRNNIVFAFYTFCNSSFLRVINVLKLLVFIKLISFFQCFYKNYYKNKTICCSKNFRKIRRINYIIKSFA